MAIDKSTLARKHPDYETWTGDEKRQRASFVATVRALSPYLVPHHFEKEEYGDLKKGEVLPRAKLGYGVGLNKSYLSEILGHVRSAARVYDWNALGGEEVDEMGRPEGGVAKLLWDDATKGNRTWLQFFHRDVLGWMLTSVGVMIVVDIDPGPAPTQADAQRAGKRPYLTMVPMSKVEDVGRSKTGFRFVKLLESVDERQPDKNEGDIVYHRIMYKLNDQGETIVSRYDQEGEPVKVRNRDGQEVDEVNMGVIKDRQGEPILPVELARFGEHPDIPWLGEGALMGMDDIVLDLYNTITEMREGFRDAAISLWIYQGDQYGEVKTQFDKGSRLIHAGDAETDTLERTAGDGAEVDAAIQVIGMAIQAWALSAKRRADEAIAEAGGPRSGKSLTAEFQLDLKPFLVEIASALDQAESNAMFIAAQLQDETATPDGLADLKVVRNTDFDLEDEATRISRIVDEFVESLNLPPEAEFQLTMRWIEAVGLIDLDAKVETEDGTRPAREVIEEQVRARVEAKAASADRLLSQGFAGQQDGDEDDAVDDEDEDDEAMGDE